MNKWIESYMSTLSSDTDFNIHEQALPHAYSPLHCDVFVMSSMSATQTYSMPAYRPTLPVITQLWQSGTEKMVNGSFELNS